MTGDVFPGVAAGTRTVVPGDSKAEGVTPATSFPARFASLPVSAGLGPVFNLGRSGRTLADLVATYQAEVKPHAPGQALNPAGTPTILCVCIGANDLFQLAALGYGNAVGYYTAFCNYLGTAIVDGFIPMALTAEARADHLDPLTEWNREVFNNALRHNTQLRWLVEQESVFWDLSDLGWWNPDGIHKNEAGDERLARLIAQTLLSGGSPGTVNGPLRNRTNTWTKPQAFTGRAIYVSSGTGQSPGIYFMENLIARFFLYLTASGDLAVDRHDNAGAVVEQEVIKITRDTGELVLKRAIKVV